MVKAEDQLLFDLREGGLDWHEVFGAWRLKTRRNLTDNSLRSKYQVTRRMLGLQPEGRPSSAPKISGLRKTLLKGMPRVATFSGPQSETNSEGIVPTNAAGWPACGGKSYSQEAVNEFLANAEKDESVAEECTMDGEVEEKRFYAREPSPVTSDDGLFWAYQVTRKTWPIIGSNEDDDNEEKYPWALCCDGEVFSSLAEANGAANQELYRNPRGLPIWIAGASLDLSIRYTDSMVFYMASSSKAKTMIKVDKTLITPNTGELPQSKVGWLSKNCYVVMQKTVKTLSTTDCVRGPVVNQQAESIAPHRGFDVAAASLCQDFKMQENHLTSEQATGDPGALDDLFDEHAEGSTSRPMEKAGQEPHGPDNEARFFKTTDVQMIGGVYTILDMANRDAAKRYLDLVVPKSARIDDVQKRKEMEEEMAADLDRLESNGEPFEMVVEIEDEGREVTFSVEITDINGPRNI